MMNLFLFFVFLNIQLTQHASINELTKNDCTYKDGRFGRINLSQVGLKHGIPAFRYIHKDDFYYSYNPCYAFSEESTCINVAICQTYKDESMSVILGYNSIVTWSISMDGKATLVYSTDDRQTIVNLVCSQELDQLIINGEYEHKHYNLTLSSKCACWNEC
ncbi:unnamed protein product [Rotaria sp. Silwood2]|nr:unnamed protein product [Rotaria sp. Silwood2]CAF2813721.1 unnamed protein product [Rotaria sp. Silwood2]CAF3058838.1 unnamed protein product [Rotaria sp. Silwood2]CAF3271974.1 unnamed protein product [Rotaria sp. Silwood2]CAF4188617.1 unnamed protein product [Rotaria sp. Silwood2]